MKITELKGKKICILGFGREGQATYRAIRMHVKPDLLTVADLNPAPLTDLECKTVSGHGYLEGLEKYDLIIKTPGISLPLGNNLNITNATQLFLDSLPNDAVVIGVTGTKGKSTTSNLIYNILTHAGKPAYLAGNIGIPMLDLLPEVTPGSTVVLELSSYQLENLTSSPHVAVLTSFFPDHTDHHGSVAQYKAAKTHITKYQKTGDFVYYNAESPDCAEIASASPGQKIPFSANDLPEIEGISANTKSTNLAAAFVVTTHLGVDEALAAKLIAQIPGLPHRLQSLGLIDGVEWVDDSASSTPQSAVNALSSLGDRVDTLIVGGMNRNYDFTELGRKIAQSNIRNIILFPETGQMIRATIEDNHPEANQKFFATSSMDEAVEFARSNTAPEKICLLSSGAPSYNLYANFNERGDDFANAVLRHEKTS